MLRGVAGAVRNTAHAHNVTLPNNFARSVAKRAIGTLSALTPPEALAGDKNPSQEGSGKSVASSDPSGSNSDQGPRKGDRLTSQRRSPLRQLHLKIAKQMIKIKSSRSQEDIDGYIRVLQHLDAAAIELERLEM
jgi:hypothetical protein